MIRGIAWTRAGLLSAVLGLALTATAQAVTITEFPVEAGAPAGKHVPFYIASSPDGTLWYTDDGTASGLGHMTTDGEGLNPVSFANHPVDLAFDAAGNLWWVMNAPTGSSLNDGLLARRSPDGSFAGKTLQNTVLYAVGFNHGEIRWTASSPGRYCKFAGEVLQSEPVCVKPPGEDLPRLTGLSLDANGRLWTIAPEANKLFRVKTDESPDQLGFDQSTELVSGSAPTRAALGTDGNLWFPAYGSNRIYRMTPNGIPTKVVQLPAGQGPNAITLGPDGAIWFTEFNSSSIGRVTTSGQYTSYPVPTADAGPYALTTGADGNIWFTEYKVGKIGRLVPDAVAGGGGGGGGGGAGSGDSFAPRFLRGLAFSPTRFRRSSRSLAVNTVTRRRATPIGSQMRFTLSEAATVTIAIDRPAPGRRVGRACLAPTRARRSKPRCTRYLRARTLTRKALQGPNQIAFTGRFGGRNLALGTYRATATAVDAAKNRSRVSVARFTLVAR